MFMAGAACALLALAGTASATEVEPRLTFEVSGAAPKSVAITLDACAGGFDRRIIDALVEVNARATVFVTERWLKNNPHALAELKLRPDLFEIENHGARHVAAVTDAATVFGIPGALTLAAVREEVEGGAKAVESATGARPKWYRGATARYSRDALELIASQGMKVAGFSVNADMGASLGRQAVARRIAAARSGDVVIAHVNQPMRPAGQGVADGVRALAAAGVRFVRLDEVETKAEDGAPLLGARREVERQLAVQRPDRRGDLSRDAGHSAASHNLALPRPAGGEPDRRNNRNGQMTAQDRQSEPK